MEDHTEDIDYRAVVEQLQTENERLREKLASNTSFSPITDAIDNMIVVVKHSDPMRLYLWACIICICVTALVQVIEVFFK
jgi:hypothetical protein